MKNLLLLIFGLIVLISCNKGEDEDLIPVDQWIEVCTYRTKIMTPNGFEIDTIGQIDFKGSVQSFQFVDEKIGYAMLHNVVGGFVEVFKTIDGGKTWTDVNIGFNHHPIGMVFKDENLGIITVHDVTGCPSNCQNKCVILKTTNSGKNWEEKEIKELKGILYDPKFDSIGNLYAILNSDGESALMKSTDNGEKWDTLFSSEDVNFTLVTYSFEIFEDEIYISGKDGKILIVNTSGDLLKTMEVGNNRNYEVEIVDKNNIIVVLSDKVLKTINGGETWETIYNNSARMIGFDSPEQGLMILQKSSCPTDVYQVNDLIASTNDGGFNWIESDETTTNLSAFTSNTQKVKNGSWYFMIDNKLLEIKK